MNGGVFGPPFPVVNDQKLCLAHVEVEVVGAFLYAVSLLSVIRPTIVVSSANLMMVLELCLATQLWVNREYRKGLIMQP